MVLQVTDCAHCAHWPRLRGVELSFKKVGNSILNLISLILLWMNRVPKIYAILTDLPRKFPNNLFGPPLDTDSGAKPHLMAFSRQEYNRVDGR